MTTGNLAPAPDRWLSAYEFVDQQLRAGVQGATRTIENRDTAWVQRLVSGDLSWSVYLETNTAALAYDEWLKSKLEAK